MNAHSARFSARRKGSGEPTPQVFLKVLAQKSSNRRVFADVATRNCAGTYAKRCAVLDLIPEEPSYGDGGILYHGWGGGGSASLGGGSYSADAPRRNLWISRFRVARVRVILRAGRHDERKSRPGRLSHGIPGSCGLSESVPRSERPIVRTVRLHLRLLVFTRPRRTSDSKHRHGRKL